MNTQAIRDELSQFIYGNFDAQDMDILNELSEVFIQSHSCQLPTGGEQTMDGAIRTCAYLNLDTVMEFMARKTDRGRIYDTILKNIHPTVVARTTPKIRGGQPCQITFKTFEGKILK